MLSKRLRRRLRQIDGREVERAGQEASEDANDRELTLRDPVRVGTPGLSRHYLADRDEASSRGTEMRETAGATTTDPPRGSLEELVPGKTVKTNEGSYWLIEQPVAEIFPYAARVLKRFGSLMSRLEGVRASDLFGLSSISSSELILLDTETAGLSSAPIFLVGLIAWKSDSAEEALSLQLLARDYAEERAVLAASAELLQGCRTLMTYNGKSFDLPLMRERMIYHGLGECPEPLTHLDLLYPVRERFRRRWENCKLTTVERNLCGRLRRDDIPGADIPDAYHDFVHTGDAAEIARVLEHNRLDLITMLEALPYLQDAGDSR